MLCYQLGLPPTLIKSLIPYLTISHLAELQPQLTQRGKNSVVVSIVHRKILLFVTL